MKKICLFVLCLFFLASCSKTTQQKLGIIKNSPNEAVVPCGQTLKIPPQYENQVNLAELQDHKFEALSEEEKSDIVAPKGLFELVPESK